MLQCLTFHGHSKTDYQGQFLINRIVLYFVNMGLDALIIVYVSKHNRDIKCALNKYEMAFCLYQIRMQKMMKICFVRIFVLGIFLQLDFLCWNCYGICNQGKSPSIEIFLQFLLLTLYLEQWTGKSHTYSRFTLSFYDFVDHDYFPHQLNMCNSYKRCQRERKFFVPEFLTKINGQEGGCWYS